jgi:hypothetical protein
MHRTHRLALAALLVASLGAVPPPGAAAASGASSAPKHTGRTGLVRVRYDAPTDPAHRPAYDRLRERKVLETFAEVLGTIRLPRPLMLKFAGCGGTSNAWYENEDQTVTFCYELVADAEKAADGAAAYGISKEDATEGPVIFILLHESGHAIFDLLQVPILGREEDAADQFAADVLLRAGKGIARRVLTGTAWMYKHDASARALEESDYADVHGLDVQRFYNVLCMAYGADAKAFAGLVEKGYLPQERAEGCAEEYAQVRYAVRTLISPSLDPEAARRTFTRYRSRWNAPRSTAAPGAAENAAAAPAPPPAPQKK